MKTLTAIKNITVGEYVTEIIITTNPQSEYALLDALGIIIIHSRVTNVYLFSDTVMVIFSNGDKMMLFFKNCYFVDYTS